MRREIANSNERRRMQSINAGFQSLRSLLPHHEGEKLSKVSVELQNIFSCCIYIFIYVLNYRTFWMVQGKTNFALSTRKLQSEQTAYKLLYNTLWLEQWESCVLCRNKQIALEQNERTVEKHRPHRKTLSSFCAIYLTELADPFSLFIFFSFCFVCCFSFILLLLCHNMNENTLERPI